MKKTDLEKNKALKIMEKMKKGATPGRFSTDSGLSAVDKREQRRKDQAAGLVSFPVKLKQEHIDAIHALAAQQETSVNDVMAALLDKALKP